MRRQAELSLTLRRLPPSVKRRGVYLFGMSEGAIVSAAFHDAPFATLLRGRIIISFSCEHNYWNYNRHEDVGGFFFPAGCAALASLLLPRMLQGPSLQHRPNLRPYHLSTPRPIPLGAARQQTCSACQGLPLASWQPDQGQESIVTPDRLSLPCPPLQAWPATPTCRRSTSWASRTSTLG